MINRVIYVAPRSMYSFGPITIFRACGVNNQDIHCDAEPVSWWIIPNRMGPPDLLVGFCEEHKDRATFKRGHWISNEEALAYLVMNE